MKQIRKSSERGHANHGWLDSHHTFSFADYYDPAHTHYHSLRVINEDRVAPEMGFSTHPHRDMEIITYVIDGALRHRDSMGHTAVMRRGDVQRISAGTGIEHSEINDSTTEPVHFLQIWILPDRKNVTPDYAQKSFDNATTGRLHLIASKTGRDSSLPINQDADLYLGKLNRNSSLSFSPRADRHLWIQIIRGPLSVNGTDLESGDALALDKAAETTFSAGNATAEFLLFDLN
jgi:quercetin 2,3-dioxygenase